MPVGLSTPKSFGTSHASVTGALGAKVAVLLNNFCYNLRSRGWAGSWALLGVRLYAAFRQHHLDPTAGPPTCKRQFRASRAACRSLVL